MLPPLLPNGEQEIERKNILNYENKFSKNLATNQ